jgi:hypothetical protein
MSSRTSTVYKYVKEHYPVSKEYRGAGEHQVENPWRRMLQIDGADLLRRYYVQICYFFESQLFNTTCLFGVKSDRT